MNYIHFPAKHRRSGTTLQKMKRRGDHKKWLLTREVLPGYPWQDQFKTREEVEAYVSGSEITCLLCGKPYKNLGIHTKRTHEISAADYKFKFNIPQYFGIVSQDTKELAREFMASPKGRAQAEALRATMIAKGRNKPYVRPTRICAMVRETSANNLYKDPEGLKKAIRAGIMKKPMRRIQEHGGKWRVRFRPNNGPSLMKTFTDLSEAIRWRDLMEKHSDDA